MKRIEEIQKRVFDVLELVNLIWVRSYFKSCENNLSVGPYSIDGKKIIIYGINQRRSRQTGDIIKDIQSTLSAIKQANAELAFDNLMLERIIDDISSGVVSVVVKQISTLSPANPGIPINQQYMPKYSYRGNGKGYYKGSDEEN